MISVLEYIMFALVAICVVRELLVTRSHEPIIWRIEGLNLLQGHQQWLEHIEQARRQGTLGGPRLENRGGHLCVVGLGRCQEVQSVQEGYHLLTSMQSQIAGIF